jgi:glycosyltransferase involved in cell wall biosynthesis/SAM-dependent methyltransferase
VKVLVVTEYYPRAGDPVRGIWAHRQALAARDAGAEVRVIVLHRPLPPLASIRERNLAAAAAELRQPARAELDGMQVDYVRYLSPPRSRSYERWGGWAAPALGRRIRALRREFPYELIHAHYAIPAGDAAHRVAGGTPLVVSVHGHDVFGVGSPSDGVRHVLAHSALVLANSHETARRSAQAGARATRVVHLGADLPPSAAQPPARPTIVTVAHLASRKRHDDMLVALALVRERHPDVSYVIVGDGPEREPLRHRIAELGLDANVRLLGALPPADALTAAQDATLFAMPSVDEAFGVAYIEAMAAGVPAIGCRGEAGPEEIAAAGGGIELVPPGDPPALAGAITRLLDNPERLAAMREAARANVAAEFTWERCGRETVDSYEQAIRIGGGFAVQHDPHPPAADASGSEPYTAGNVLDRLTPEATLEHHYAHMHARERELLSAALPLRGGRVLSIGAGWHPGRHLFPAPEFELVAVDAEPDRVAGVLESGRADAAFVGRAGALDELEDHSFDVVLYRLVMHHLVFQGPLAPSFREAARLLRPGGALVVIEPGLWHPVGLALALANRIGLATAIHGTPDDVPLSPRRLRDEALAAGLAPELFAVTYTWRRLPPALQRAIARFDVIGSNRVAASFGHTLLLVARC